MKKQNFASGAAVLAVAIGLGKIFSAIFKIPLDRFFLHSEGMAIFNSAYNLYLLFFTIATAGIPLAISALVAASKSKDEEQNILSTALIAVQGVLLVCGLLIFTASDFIASFIGMPQAAPAFRVMAPALAFCGITASLRGFFQGKRVMAPSALSQVSDSFGRLFLGFLLVAAISSATLQNKAAAAISGVPFGAFLSAVILVVAFIKSKEGFRFSFSGSILKKIFLVSLPLTITTALHPIFNVVDTLFCVPLLSGISTDAQSAFGCLCRSATLYALPVSIASAVSASILPAVSENFKNRKLSLVNREASFALRLAIIISIPCSAGFMAISRQIFNLLYNDSGHHTTLVYIAPCAVLLSVGCVLSCILQGLGKTRETTICALCAVLFKLALTPPFLLLMGINGAACASTASYLAFVILLSVFIKTKTPVRFSLFSVALRSLFCAALCFSAAFFTVGAVHTSVSIFLAAAVYIIAIFATKLITFGEFKQIFSG